FFAEGANTQPSGTGLLTPGIDLFDVNHTALLNVDSQSGNNISPFVSGRSVSMTEKAVLEFNAGGSGIGFSQGMQQVAAVPEPATWAMMLLGLAGVGLFGLRRRRGSFRLV